MLHCTKDRLLWECRECTAPEDQPEMKYKRETNQQVAEYLFNQRILDNAEDAAQTSVSGYVRNRLNWYALVESYFGKGLSVKTDKLPAMSGIVAEIATRREDDEYLAGLWKKDIFRGLSWFPEVTNYSSPLPQSKSPVTAVDLGIPSWSWAAYDGAIKYHGETWFNGAWEKFVQDGEESWIKQPPKIKLLEAYVKRSDLDPFGRVFGGEILLSGWAIELSISEKEYSPDDVNLINFDRKCYSLKKHPELPCSTVVCFDTDPTN